MIRDISILIEIIKSRDIIYTRNITFFLPYYLTMLLQICLCEVYTLACDVIEFSHVPPSYLKEEAFFIGIQQTVLPLLNTNWISSYIFSLFLEL